MNKICFQSSFRLILNVILFYLCYTFYVTIYKHFVCLINDYLITFFSSFLMRIKKTVFNVFSGFDLPSNYQNKVLEFEVGSARKIGFALVI